MKTITIKFCRFLIVMFFMGLTFHVSAQFVPGEGGVLPPAPVFTPQPNTLGALYISSVQRMNNAFIGGTYNEVNLTFPSPDLFDGVKWNLQSFNTTKNVWENFKYNDEDVTTSGNNFSIITTESTQFRLLLEGGEKNGWTTNQVSASVSTVNTYFSAWGLDESMMISGVMIPYIGRGLEASFGVSKLSDNTLITDALTYQWYRVNPATFEFTSISGATSLKYITTEADAGYYLNIRATGDGTKAGGFCQIFSSMKNMFQVKAFASNVSTAGFTINLYKSVSDVNANNLILLDNEFTPIPISAITMGENAAIYNFAAVLNPEKAPYMLMNEYESETHWHIASVMEQGFVMPVLNIEFPSAVNTKDVVSLRIYPQPANDFFSFNSDKNVISIAIYGIKGEKIYEETVCKHSGNVSVQHLNSGLYFVKFVTEDGEITKKLVINK